MQNYRKTSHYVYDLKYHLVWITKYRKPVFFGDMAVRLRDLIREICKSLDIEIIKGHVSKDHVHLFVSVSPQLFISKINPVSEEMVTPWKSIMMDRLKSGRIASFWLSPHPSTMETPESLNYSPYII